MYLSIAANRSLVGAAFVTLLSLAATAAAEAPAPGQCEFVAFVDETDPAGLNVRAQPSVNARVVGKLPPVWVDPADGAQVRVRTEVIGASKGWFRIRNSADEDQLTERPARPTYAGEGWVSGRKLIVKAQTGAGRIRPDTSAPIGLQLKDERLFDSRDFAKAGTLVDCEGGWVQMEFVDAKIPAEIRSSLDIAPEARTGLPPGRFRLWLDRICGSQETSCDGF